MRKAISLLLTLILSLSPLLPALAEAQEQASQAGASVWENRMFSQDVTIREDLLVRGDVTLLDGAQILVEDATLYVQPGAVITGDISLLGGARLEMGGTVKGNVHVLDNTARLYLTGRVEGTVSVETIGEKPKLGWTDLQEAYQVEISPEGFVDTLLLAGTGEVLSGGEIRLLDTDATNRTWFTSMGGRIGTLYARSDGFYCLDEGARVGEIVMDCLLTSEETHGHISSLALYSGARADTVRVDAGFLDVFGGSHVGTLLMCGNRSECHIDMAVDEHGVSDPYPTVDRLIQTGRNVHTMTRGRITYLYANGGSVDSYGYIETLVNDGAYVVGDRGKYFGGEDALKYYDTEIPDVYFTRHFDDLIQLRGSMNLSDEVRIARALVLGGSVEDYPEDRSTLLRPQGMQNDAQSLSEGVSVLPSGALARLACDAYTAVTLDVSGHGLALVETPDGDFHLLDCMEGAQNLSLMTQTAGDLTMRLIATGEGDAFNIHTRLETPVRVDCTLTERGAAVSGEKPAVAPGDVARYVVALHNETTGTEIVNPILGDGVLYAMPETASPGDTLRLTLARRDGAFDPISVSFILDENRRAEAAPEAVARGSYTAAPPDTARAHLYLYDGEGRFLREVFDRGGVYDTGALAAGAYSAVFIRAGVGGWKLLELSDFAANGLVEGTHYLCKTINIENGVILPDAPKIPEEPTLQSPYFHAENTLYQARASAVVEGALALFALEWSLTDAEMADPRAEIAFLPGARYVEGSAVVDGVAGEARWDGNTLRVPLDKKAGKLLFYVEGDESAQALVSNAFITLTGADGMLSQYVGSAQVKIAPLSIFGPSLTSESAVTVYGYAAPYSQVSVLDNDFRAASAVADGKGLWSANVPLGMESTHVLEVESEDGLRAAPHALRRVAGAPSIRHFTMHYVEHGVAKEISVPGEDFGRRTIRFAYEPGTDMTFLIEMENDEYVQSVTLVAEMDGLRQSLEAIPEGGGVWAFTGRFTEDTMFAPDEFTVEYTFRQEAMALAMREVYAEVPLLDILYTMTDIEGDLTLTRYYMADPALQRADVGFGPGWLTEYDEYATLSEAGGLRALSIWSPTGSRLFTGEGNRLREVGGYAMASIRSGAATITEANGATRAFDATGRLVAASDAYGQKTALRYDEVDRLIEVKDGNATLSLSRGAQGLIERAACGETEIAYAYTQGYLTATETADARSTLAYDGLGTRAGHHALSCVIGEDGGANRFRYDAQGRPVWMEQDGEALVLTYGEGALTVADGQATQVYTLDELGALRSIESSAGERVVREDLDSGYRMVMTNAVGAQSALVYGAKGELLEATDAAGGMVQYEYDKRGNLSAITDALGNRTRYAHDERGALTSVTHADGTAEKWTVDRQGNTTRYTDRAGQRTDFTYDKQNRLTRAAYADGTRTEYLYNEDGSEIEVREGESSYWLHPEEEGMGVWTGEMELHSDSDTNGSHLNVGEHGTYSDWNQGKLTWFGSYGGALSVETAYDARGNIARETRGNGAATAYAYDERDRLVRMENFAPGGEALSFFAMEYDAQGNIARYETAEGVWQYVYDAVGQLTRVESPDGALTEYAYDAAGNRVSETVNGVTRVYEVNELNQYTKVGDTQYTYDKNGNLIRAESPECVTTYAWDARGRLKATDDGQTSAEYAYDPLGNRASVTVNGETSRYWTMPGELSQTLAIDTPTGRTIYYTGDGGLYGASRDEQTVYYLFDPRGSVTEILDQSGNVLRRYAYDAQGNIVADETSIPDIPEAPDMPIAEEDIQAALSLAALAKENPFTYVGRWGILNDVNGLWSMRARFVDPATGRFVSPDPAGQTYDVNLYRYAANNPVRNADLTGCNLNGDWFDPNNQQRYYYIGQEQQRRGYRDMSWGFVNEDPPNVARDMVMVFSGAGMMMLIIGGIIVYGPMMMLGTTNWLLGNAPLMGWFGTNYGKDLYDLFGNLKEIIFPDNRHKAGGTPVDGAVDPSGYVYEAVHSNRVEGVTATVYVRGEEGEAIRWAADEYGQESPQQTDFLGLYGWYVPAGEWRVTYEKEGYEPLQTAWLPVPPPQTEVNMGVVSREAPALRHAARYAEGAEIAFTKYMEIDSVRAAITLLAPDGAAIPVTLTPLDEEPAADDGRPLASRFLARAEGGVPSGATLTLGAQAVSYAGTPALPVRVALPDVWKLDDLGLEAEYAFQPDGTAEIILQAVGEGHFDALRLTAALSDENSAAILGVTPFDAEGRAVLTLETRAVGKATLRLYEETNDFEAVALLTVSPAPTCLYEAIVNTRGDAGVSLWESPARARALAQAPKGETVRVLSEEGNGWVFAAWGDAEGYVDSQYLKRK